MAEPKKNSKKSSASTAKKPSSAKKKTTTKKSSAKKAAPQKAGMDRGLKNTLWGIVFIAMALLTFLCFFDGVIGPVGSGLKVALCWAMGATAIGVPLFFLILAVFRIMDRKAVVGKRIWGLIGLYATVSTLWSALSVELNGMGFTDYVATLAGKGLDMVGGGAITSPLAWLSLSLLNKIGTIIVCIFIILILLVFLSGVTFATLFDRKPEEEEEEYETLGGLVFGQLAVIPEDGSQPRVTALGMDIQVEEIADHRVEWAVITKLPQPEEQDED